MQPNYIANVLSFALRFQYLSFAEVVNVLRNNENLKKAKFFILKAKEELQTRVDFSL